MLFETEKECNTNISNIIELHGPVWNLTRLLMLTPCNFGKIQACDLKKTEETDQGP